MKNLELHPAVRLGAFLRKARQEKGFVKRTFAHEVKLSPSQYSEAEAGVVRWIGVDQETAIVGALEFSRSKLKKFRTLVKAARADIPLVFANLFSREQLEPIRYRHMEAFHQPTKLEKEVILNQVLAEIH